MKQRSRLHSLLRGALAYTLITNIWGKKILEEGVAITDEIDRFTDEIIITDEIIGVSQLGLL